MPIISVVLSAVQATIEPGEIFDLGKLDLPDLTRRQVTTALHGLSQGALAGQLANVGKGLWVYTPNLLGPSPGSRFFDNVELGFETSFVVVGIVRTTLGVEYYLRTPLGTILRAMPLLSLEYNLDGDYLLDSTTPRPPPRLGAPKEEE